jgi:hypothetical protein
MYQYKVILDVYGGEVTVGSIPTPTYDYWTQRGLETLRSHLTLDDIPDVPIEHQLYPWFEHDDLIHTNGVEFKGINQIQVVDLSTDEEEFVSFMDEDCITDNAWVINDTRPVIPPDHVILNCTSIEKGYWVYETIQTQERFDISKLEFFLYHVNGIFIVDHLTYDGMTLDYVGSSTREIEFLVSFD